MSRISKTLLGICLILSMLSVAIFFGCTRQNSLSPSDESGISISLLKTVDIGAGARPEVVATNDRVFVVYLANISVQNPNAKTHSLKIFNSDLTQEIVSKDLVSYSSKYGSPIDVRIASDGNYLYVFYQTTFMDRSYLFGAKYTLDDNFEKVAYTPEPIATGPMWLKAQPGDELVNDPIPLIGPNSVFVITRIKQKSFSKEEPMIYRVREFTSDLQTKLAEFDLDLSSVAGGSPRQASAIYYNGYYYMIVPTTTESGDYYFDMTTPSDLLLVKLNQDWQIVESKFISQEPDDVETFVTGFQVYNGYFFITYKQGYKEGSKWAYVLRLKVYDQNFNLVLSDIVRKATCRGESLKSSLEVTDDRIYVGVAAGQGPPPPGVLISRRSVVGQIAEIYVYEW